VACVPVISFRSCVSARSFVFSIKPSLLTYRRVSGIYSRQTPTNRKSLEHEVVAWVRLCAWCVGAFREQLRQTVAEINPAMLILDPFIRLHRSDENASKEVAPLLGYLRELQREHKVAVLLVHHVRKGSATKRPGQALRGSSDLHGWGDSNLYLRKNGPGLLLSIEHRAAPSHDNIPVELCQNGSALALTVKTGQEHTSPPATTSENLSPSRRVILAMKEIAEPVSVQELRRLCRMRTSTLCEILAGLKDRGDVIHGPHGYSLASHQCKTAVSLPDTPIDSSGNGNGKPLRQLSFR